MHVTLQRASSDGNLFSSALGTCSVRVSKPPGAESRLIPTFSVGNLRSQLLDRLDRFRQLPFAFNFPSSAVTLQCTTRRKFREIIFIFLETLQNSSWKIQICFQFSFARVSHVWRLQTWRRKKKKLVQTCCLMRKSSQSLKHRRRLQHSPTKWRCFWRILCSRSCPIIFRNCLLFLERTINVLVSWDGCLNEGKSCKSTWNLLPPFGLVRLLRGWHFSTWDQARDKWP